MPVDYSPLFSQAPESGMARGQRFFADALDAVMQRRQQAELQARHLEAQAQENRLQRELTGGYYGQLGEQFHEQEARLGKEHAITARQKDSEIAAAEHQRHTTALIEAGKSARVRGGMPLANALISPFAAGPGALQAPPPAMAAPPPQAPPPEAAPAPPAPAAPGAFAPPPPAPPGAVEPMPYDKDITGMPLALTGPGGIPAPRPAPAAPPPMSAPAPAPPPPAPAAPQPQASALDLSGMAPDQAGAAFHKLTAHLPRDMGPFVEQGALLAAETGDVEKAYRDTVGAELDRRGRAQTARTTASRRDSLSAGESGRLKQQWVTGFENSAKEFKQQNNLDKLADGFNTFFEAQGGIEDYLNKRDTIGGRDAKFAIARLITGPGVLTSSEYDKTVQNTKGITENLISKVKGLISGDFSPEEALAIRKFVANSQIRLHERAVHGIVGFDQKYGPGDQYFDNIPDQVEHERQAMMSQFAVDDVDVDEASKAASDQRSDRRIQQFMAKQKTEQTDKNRPMVERIKALGKGVAP